MVLLIDYSQDFRVTLLPSFIIAKCEWMSAIDLLWNLDLKNV